MFKSGGNRFAFGTIAFLILTEVLNISFLKVVLMKRVFFNKIYRALFLFDYFLYLHEKKLWVFKLHFSFFKRIIFYLDRKVYGHLSRNIFKYI